MSIEIFSFLLCDLETDERGDKSEGIAMTKYNPDIHHRRSIRLKGYDYAQCGCYFITICTQGRENLFGSIQNRVMILNDAGKMIDYQWNNLAGRFTHIELDEYIVMPNHLHGIITVGATLVVAQNVVAPNTNNRPNIRAGTRPAPTKGTANIGDMVGAFKSITSCEYIEGVKNNHYKSFDGKLWQRNYYEQIIRPETSLRRIQEYIRNNPRQWQQDELFTA